MFQVCNTSKQLEQQVFFSVLQIYMSQENINIRGGTWIKFSWVCAADLPEHPPHYSLFCGQL